ncbi:MAG: 16S rRNA (uracil(1498)-N(3))-methyltransferase [Pseudomonadales bacterium]|nr:16S rRNA (uracil(1498)-N(3))-methyltransferase [Pseudomonadales bacterium]
MRIPRVYLDQALATDAKIRLTPETSHYLIRVLRLPVNAALKVFAGTGGEYDAKIIQADRHTVTIELGTFTQKNNSSPLAIHLGIAISKGERMDVVMQKATELGVTSITPLFSERCEVKLKADRMEKKLSHWTKVVASACEQSGLNLLPKVNLPTQFCDWVRMVDTDLKLILQPATDKPLDRFARPLSVSLLIGPEGGFSEVEVAQALNARFQPLQLGPRILRTETAPLSALSILQYLWGDLG